MRREWAAMGDDFDASWSVVGPRVFAAVTAAQVAAAQDGAFAVPLALAQQGQSVAPVARVVPNQLAGVASDGRSLLSLLESSVVEAKRASALGRSPAESLAIGGRHLEMVAHTQVADTARDASSLAITARRRVVWVRLVNPPCCQRCAVLAGKVFGFNQGFKRHPRCDCTHVPQTEANPHLTGVTIGPDDVKDLTVRQREAIADGADFNRTINDYQRKRGDFLPPTRVENITTRARSRDSAVEALAQAGYLAA